MSIVHLLFNFIKIALHRACFFLIKLIVKSTFNLFKKSILEINYKIIHQAFAVALKMERIRAR